jgi:hypothetical protein
MRRVPKDDRTVLVMVWLRLEDKGGRKIITYTGGTCENERCHTLIEIRGFRGFRWNEFNNLSVPMSSKASGNCVLNHERIWSLWDNVSNSVVGANNVQVNDLSCPGCR